MSCRILRRRRSAVRAPVLHRLGLLRVEVADEFLGASCDEIRILLHAAPLTVDDDSAFLFTTWFGQCHSIWATSHSANVFLRPEAYRSSPCPACGWMPSGPSQSVCAAIALFQSTRIESVGCLRT